jgi:hypothetical protein
MKEVYSSGGTVRSVPGCKRSTSRGDWPDEILEGAVALLCRVLMLSEPNALCDPAREPGPNESTGDIDWDVIKYGDDSGTAYVVSADGYEDCGNEVWSGSPCIAWYCEGGGG